jgi:ubiquinone biosynthesis O-methyltransferase
MVGNARNLWNRASQQYQNNLQIVHDRVTYGPWSPDDQELGIIGPVQGLKVLDLGCGGGQNCVALARLGAEVTGVDISDAQLEFARELAAQQAMTVRFLQGDVECFDDEVDGQFDLILAVQLLSYLEEPATCLRAYRQLLRDNGRFIMSLNHPMRSIFYDMEELEMVSYPARSYFDTRIMRWELAGSDIMLSGRNLPMSLWIDHLHQAGLHLQQLVEPAAPAEMLDTYMPEDGPLAPLRNIPHTAIFVATAI